MKEPTIEDLYKGIFLLGERVSRLEKNVTDLAQQCVRMAAYLEKNKINKNLNDFMNGFEGIVR